ncbi:MAG: ABC transporter ATP-binding protein [Dehalococcoidia bacterium]
MKEQGTARAGVEVKVVEVQHRFGDFWALKGASLVAQDGEFLTLLGPSGSGKTSLLRIIGGLLRPTGGRVFIGERDVTSLPARKRNIGFVFQNYALFPHITVFENVAFPLRLRKLSRQEIVAKVKRVLELVELAGLETRYPSELSGGQQQRVALARAIVFEPTVLLMDEPLGSLDKRLRQQLQIELRRLQRELGITTIYVTHDQEEAFSMSDRIAVMRSGEIVQIDSPAKIYRSPADDFIANFVGDLNRFDGSIVQRNASGGLVRTTDGMSFRIPLHNVSGVAKAVICGVRPEHLRIGRKSQVDNCYRGTLSILNFQGSYYRAEINLETGRRLLAEIHSRTESLKEGDEVWVGWDSQDMMVFE